MPTNSFKSQAGEQLLAATDANTILLWSAENVPGDYATNFARSFSSMHRPFQVTYRCRAGYFQ